MSGNRAVYQTNEPNECAQCVWLWKIGHTNITGKACSTAMLLQRHSSHEDIRESVGSHNPARTSSGSVFELWISDGFEWFFAVNFLYPKFAVFAWSKQLMPTSQWSFDSIFGFVVSKKAIWFVAFFGPVGPIFPCNKSHEAMKNSSLSAALPEAWGPWELQHAPPTHYGCIMLAKGKR